MLRKTFCVLVAAATLAGCAEEFPKTVDGAPHAVMDSFADLDIRELPGQPGSTAEAAGGVKPVFRLKRLGNTIEWVVTSNGQVATRMIATFDPVDGGARTHISARVERGNAPDERISPAFRDPATTLGLFHTALQAELDEMTLPGWGAHCDGVRDEVMNAGGPGMTGPEAIAKVYELNQKLRAAGCNPDKAPGAGGGFKTVDTQMAPAGADDGWGNGAPPDDAG